MGLLLLFAQSHVWVIRLAVWTEINLVINIQLYQTVICVTIIPSSLFNITHAHMCASKRPLTNRVSGGVYISLNKYTQLFSSSSGGFPLAEVGFSPSFIYTCVRDHACIIWANATRHKNMKALHVVSIKLQLKNSDTMYTHLHYTPLYTYLLSVLYIQLKHVSCLCCLENQKEHSSGSKSYCTACNCWGKYVPKHMKSFCEHVYT